MQDQEFIRQFEDCTLPKEYLNHRNHVRLAWIYLSQLPLEEALLKVTQGIIRYAGSIGASQIYNETLTQLWVYLVHQAMTEKSATFDSFINNHGYLLDKSLTSHYYSPARLQSEEARKGWLEPDLKPINKA